MKLIPINILSAVIFPFVFSACVSQSSVDFNKQQAAKARVELALGYLQQEDFVQAKLNLDKPLNMMNAIILCTRHLRIFINYKAIRKKRSKLIYWRLS